MGLKTDLRTDPKTDLRAASRWVSRPISGQISRRISEQLPGRNPRDRSKAGCGCWGFAGGLEEHPKEDFRTDACPHPGMMRVLPVMASG
ncbi:MAG: hypothetical protein IPI63_07910 [Methanothrix sp.]|uniref:hypothetical protein n=1 Tax=Methanothrix sp. TaxID=90426 RepID=UPI0025DA215E|nr:hypothetical protein [Methanothrix sp.]MBK7386644.1 hypothetical protein [Methanothrix sp.]HPW72295.1 hypothetical protein [Methanothrix sp.]